MLEATSSQLRMRVLSRCLGRTQIGRRAPSYGPNGGVAATFKDAKAAFRRSWDGYGAFESACGRSPRSNEELHEWLERRWPKPRRAKAAFRAWETGQKNEPARFIWDVGFVWYVCILWC